MTANKLLCQMVGAYLLRPDPVAWLAAADIFEENAQPEIAHRWRKRAEWFPPLLAAHGRFREAGAEFKRREYIDLGERFTVVMEQSYQRSSVYVTARLRRDRVFICQSIFWGL